MGLLDDVAERAVEEKKAYNFASSPIGDYMNELSLPKQQQDIDETAGLDLLEQEYSQAQEKDEPLEKIKMRTSVANATGNILAIATDAAFPMALGLLLKDDPEKYKATESEREELAEAFAEYAKLKGGEIPPWLALVIVILSVYGSKGVSGYQNKKLNDRNAELEKKIIELRTKYETPGDEDKESNELKNN